MQYIRTPCMHVCMIITYSKPRRRLKQNSAGNPPIVGSCLRTALRVELVDGISQGHARQHGPRGQENKRMGELRGRGSSGVRYHGGLEYTVALDPGDCYNTVYAKGVAGLRPRV